MTFDDKKWIAEIRADSIKNAKEVFLLAQLDEAHAALRFYADKKNWNYTDCCGQFDWYSTVSEDDIEYNEAVTEGGGTDYAGKHARKALGEE